MTDPLLTLNTHISIDTLSRASPGLDIRNVEDGGKTVDLRGVGLLVDVGGDRDALREGECSGH